MPRAPLWRGLWWLFVWSLRHSSCVWLGSCRTDVGRCHAPQSDPAALPPGDGSQGGWGLGSGMLAANSLFVELTVLTRG